MAYVHTNTITTLPYGYYLKVILRSDGATGTLTDSDGGYYLSVGDLEQGYDQVTGAINTGAMSFSVLNTGNHFSTNIFTATTSKVQVEVYISYNAGTSYECMFYGMVLLESLAWEAKDSSETRNRVYSFRAEDAMFLMRTLWTSTAYLSIPTETTTQNAYIYDTDEAGSPVLNVALFNMKFAKLTDLFEYALTQSLTSSTMVTAPSTVTFDWTACSHKGRNSYGSVTEYGLTAWYVVHSNASATLPTMFISDSGSGSVLDASSAAEMFRRLCEELMVVPITSYDGAGTYTVTMVPRYQASYTAVSGTMPTPLSLVREQAEWAFGGKVESDGLPMPSETYSNGSGATIQIRNYLYTIPFWDVSLQLYMLWHAYITPPGGDAKKNDCVLGHQVFGKGGANNFLPLHQINYPTSSGYPAGFGYYGFQLAIYDVLLAAQPFSAIGNILDAYQATYKTLVGTTIADLRVMKTITVNSKTCVIQSIKRDPMKNQCEIKAVEVT